MCVCVCSVPVSEMRNEEWLMWIQQFDGGKFFNVVRRVEWKDIVDEIRTIGCEAFVSKLVARVGLPRMGAFRIWFGLMAEIACDNDIDEKTTCATIQKNQKKLKVLETCQFVFCFFNYVWYTFAHNFSICSKIWMDRVLVARVLSGTWDAKLSPGTIVFLSNGCRFERYCFLCGSWNVCSFAFHSGSQWRQMYVLLAFIAPFYHPQNNVVLKLMFI